jgi:hypothetical protein
MTHQANGGIGNGADLGANSDFVVITTVIGHATGNFGVAPSDAQNLVKLMELVQQKINVKYIHVASAVVDLSDADARAAAGLGTNFNQAATTVTTIKFMTEQAGFLTADILAGLVDGVAVVNPTVGVPSSAGAVTLSAYEADNAATKNIAVVIADLF